MRLSSKDSLMEAIWEISKKGYPEWEGPETPKDGVVDYEIEEDVDYSVEHEPLR